MEEVPKGRKMKLIFPQSRFIEPLQEVQGPNILLDRT
jgi:hypothetical protein